MGDPFPSLFIVRAGEFGAELAPRFWFSVFVLCLLVWDVRRYRRFDYLWIGVTGLAVWTTAEAVLQLGGTREIARQVLFGMVIPIPIAILLQGLAEGASVAVLGVFLGDRLLNRVTRLQSILIMSISSVVLLSRGFLSLLTGQPDDLDVTSRRDLGAVTSLVFLGSVVLFDLFFS